MANAGQSRATSNLLWLSGIAVIVLIVFAVRSLTRDQVEVRVVSVTFQTLSSTVSTNGKVEPIEDFQAHAPMAGAVKQIFVSVGQRVSRGTLLVRMEDADAMARLAAAKSAEASNQIAVRDVQAGGTVEDLSRFTGDLASAQLEQQQALTDLASKEKLQQRGAASPAEVAASKQKLDAANLVLQNAQRRSSSRYNVGDNQNAQTRLADSKAAVASAQSNLANVDIRSPIDGTVYNIPVSQYDWVQFGENILDVANLNRMQVRAFFDEPEIGKLAVGQPVTIIWDAKRDESWHGHISLAPTSILPYALRNVGVALITIDDPTPDLIPNTNVTVTVTEMKRTNVLSIPREALHTEGPRSFVFRIVAGKLSQTTVTVGVVNQVSVEILSGLSNNDKIVLNAKSSVTELTAGLEVKQVQ
jgi:HlyD family secretion protein